MVSPIPLRLRGRAGQYWLAVLLWLFGLFTSVLLVGMWGRTVAGDAATLENSARAVLESQFVNQRINDWLVGGIAAAGHTSSEAEQVVEGVLSEPRVQSALASMVDEAVLAALTPPGESLQADIPSAVDSFVAVVDDELSARGVEVQSESLRQAAHGISTSMLTSDERSIITVTAQGAKALLTRVLLVGTAGILITGAAAIRLSEDRVRQARSLLTRLAVSALTFAVFLRVGAWAVDPSGGRSPVASGGAALLGSNGHVPLLLGLLAAGAGGAATYVIRRRRPTWTLPQPKAWIPGRVRSARGSSGEAPGGEVEAGGAQVDTLEGDRQQLRIR